MSRLTVSQNKCFIDRSLDVFTHESSSSKYKSITLGQTLCVVACDVDTYFFSRKTHCVRVGVFSFKSQIRQQLHCSGTNINTDRCWHFRKCFVVKENHQNVVVKWLANQVTRKKQSFILHRLFPGVPDNEAAALCELAGSWSAWLHSCHPGAAAGHADLPGSRRASHLHSLQVNQLWWTSMINFGSDCSWG